ncbi:MAG: hypothetical protein QXL35_04985 [Candidatus Bathyarchaeia archaeon]
MKGKRGGRPKGKRGAKTRRLIRPLAICLLLAFIAFLIAAPQAPRPMAPNPQRPDAPGSGRVSRMPIRAAIVDQLGAHFPNQAFISMAEGLLRRAGFDVDVYGPEEVGVGLYGSLPAKGYKLIVFRVHAGIGDGLEGRPVGLFTTEAYSPFAYPREQLAKLIGPAQAFNGSEVVFAIAPRFIRDRSIMDYPGSVIILMGCFGLYGEELPKAFIERGASAVIGWTGLVDIAHTDEATLALLGRLAEGMTIEEAVSEAMRAVGPDPEGHSALGYYPIGRGGIRIRSRAVG